MHFIYKSFADRFTPNGKKRAKSVRFLSHGSISRIKNAFFAKIP